MKKQQLLMQSKYKAVFDTPTGKEVLNDLMNAFCFGNTTVRQDAMGKVDLEGTLYREGMRTVVLHIISMTKLDFQERAEDMIERQNKGDEQ